MESESESAVLNFLTLEAESNKNKDSALVVCIAGSLSCAAD